MEASTSKSAEESPSRPATPAASSNSRSTLYGSRRWQKALAIGASVVVGLGVVATVVWVTVERIKHPGAMIQDEKGGLKFVYRLSTDKQEYAKAKKACASVTGTGDPGVTPLGYTLAMPKTKENVEEFRLWLQGQSASVGDQNRFIIGLTDEGEEGRWKWDDGTKALRVFFTTPGGTVPGGSAENCYEVWVEPNKDEVYMNDIRCEDSSRRYVCQFPEAGQRCGQGYTHENGGICYAHVRKHKTWTMAQKDCSLIDGYLAEPKTEDQNNFVREIHNAGGSSVTWLGGDDQNANGEWRWSISDALIPLRGQPGFCDWGVDEPNNAGGEACLTISYQPPNDPWNDLACNDKYEFICQKGLITTTTPTTTPTTTTNTTTTVTTTTTTITTTPTTTINTTTTTTTTTSPTTTTPEPDDDMVIIAIVGFVVLLAIGAGVYWHRKKKQEEEQRRIEEEERREAEEAENRRQEAKAQAAKAKAKAKAEADAARRKQRSVLLRKYQKKKMAEKQSQKKKEEEEERKRKEEQEKKKRRRREQDKESEGSEEDVDAINPNSPMGILSSVLFTQSQLDGKHSRHSVRSKRSKSSSKH